MNKIHHLKTPLGKETNYRDRYNPALLFPVSRKFTREELRITEPLPFSGIDVWNAYELSWLDQQGKPEIAVAEFYIPCNSINLIESKSFKLYLNSFSQTKFSNQDAVKKTLEKDVSQVIEDIAVVKLIPPHQFSQMRNDVMKGICLDDLNLVINCYQLNPAFLITEEQSIAETVYSHLFRSNCPVTDQPDWASVLVRYTGNKINHEGLLKYIISYREQNEFGEQCAERFFMDILGRCNPEKLTVSMRFTRRGGLDINPFRSNFETNVGNSPTFRQ